MPDPQPILFSGGPLDGMKLGVQPIDDRGQLPGIVRSAETGQSYELEANGTWDGAFHYRNAVYRHIDQAEGDQRADERSSTSRNRRDPPVYRAIKRSR